MVKVAGAVAVVTGASRGIGREVALALGLAGASVVLVARDRDALDAVATQIGADRSLVLVCDLADAAQVPGLVTQTLAHFGRIDILVNNAGVLSARGFLHTDVDQLARTVDVNLRAAVILTRLVAERMAVRRTGHIVNVTSLAGVIGIPGEPTYSATKAGMRLFTASLRLELGRYHISLTDLVLGTVTTGMLDEVESNPGVHRFFRRGRQTHLLVDTPAPVVAAAVVRAIEQRQAVVVLPTRARYLLLPLQGLARSAGRLLAR